MFPPSINDAPSTARPRANSFVPPPPEIYTIDETSEPSSASNSLPNPSLLSSSQPQPLSLTPARFPSSANNSAIFSPYSSSSSDEMSDSPPFVFADMAASTTPKVTNTTTTTTTTANTSATVAQGDASVDGLSSTSASASLPSSVAVEAAATTTTAAPPAPGPARELCTQKKMFGEHVVNSSHLDDPNHPIWATLPTCDYCGAEKLTAHHHCWACRKIMCFACWWAWGAEGRKPH